MKFELDKNNDKKCSQWMLSPLKQEMRGKIDTFTHNSQASGYRKVQDGQADGNTQLTLQHLYRYKKKVVTSETDIISYNLMASIHIVLAI